MRTLVVIALSVVALSGCRGCGEPEASAPQPAAHPEPETVGAAPQAEGSAEAEPIAAPEPERIIPEHPLFGRWDREGDLATLQGAWLVPDAFGGPDATWVVDGEDVVVTNGGESRSFRIDLSTPATLGLIDVEGGSITTYAFARSGERVWVGLGRAGRVIDGHIVFYDGQYHMVATATECTVYEGLGADLTPSEAAIECHHALDAAPPILRYSPAPWEGEERIWAEFEVTGDAVLTQQFRRKEARRPGAPAPPPEFAEGSANGSGDGSEFADPEGSSHVYVEDFDPGAGGDETGSVADDE